MPWETEASRGKHERAWSTYRSAIYARFHNQSQQETAYKKIMEVKYQGSIQDMITEYDTLNVKAGITGVTYRTMLMKELPPQIFKQLTTVNPAEKTDSELREIILTAGKNVEIWQATEKNFGIISKTSKPTRQVSETGRVQKRSTFGQNRGFERTQNKGKAWETPRTFKSTGGKTLCANGRRNTIKRN
jgi:hypothetical protein